MVLSPSYIISQWNVILSNKLDGTHRVVEQICERIVYFA